MSIHITAQEYCEFVAFLKKKSGIELGKNKEYLVENRLRDVLTAFNLRSFTELMTYLSINTAYALRLKAAVIDAMTTNETSWFRDDEQFKILKRTVFPEITLKNKRIIKVWSAACSSGQEPYTISMCVEEMKRLNLPCSNVQIIGTDISETALNKARTATYSKITVQRGLADAMYYRYFQDVEDGHRLNLEVTQKVRFQQLNLLEPFSTLGRFNVIFCRNVLIYFSQIIKRDILLRLAAVLEPGGFLFLSSTESIPIDLKLFKVIRTQHTRYFQKL